jgi:glycerol uptake facilitator-like aquaporin
LGHVSGVNVNPAVTIALLITGEMNIIRAIAYICCQLCGALLGAFLVKELVPEHMKGFDVLVDSKSALISNDTLSRVVRSLKQNSNKSFIISTPLTTTAAIYNNASGILKVDNFNAKTVPLGLTLLNKDLTPAQGVGIEMLVTFMLMLTVFACLDTKRKDLNGSFPLTIGLAVTIGCFFAVSSYVYCCKKVFFFCCFFYLGSVYGW